MSTAAPSPRAAESPWGSGRRCAVLGSPVGHSLSPVLHQAAYDAWGLDWVYERHEVDEAGLAGFVAALDSSWRGLSLTMPLKRVALDVADDVTPRAGMAGAANTLLLAEGRRLADNTDIAGVGAALRERWGGPVASALVVGGGATAASVMLALADLGCRRMSVAVRDRERARAALVAASRHPASPDVEVVSWDRLDADLGSFDVVVSTVPASAQDGGWVQAVAEAAPVVFDVLYDPWPTPLVRSARAADRVVVGGLDLLVHQAVRQVELMTGIADAPVGALRAAGERALSSR